MQGLLLRMLSPKFRRLFVAPLVAFTLSSSASGQPSESDEPGDPAESLGPAEADERQLSPSPTLSDPARLVRVKSLVDRARYEECVSMLDDLLGGDTQERLTDPEVVEEARLYYATCLLSVGQQKRAEQVLVEALEANPNMVEPNPYDFGDEVLELFLDVRNQRSQALEELRDKKLAAARKRARERRRSLEQLERLASTETVIVQNNRWVSAIPFGVGQFQNRDLELGWAFLLGESVALGTSIAALTVLTHLEAERALLTSGDSQVASDALWNQATARISDWNTVFKVSSWSFLALAAGGIVHAQLTFEPSFETKRQRPLPPKLRLSESLDDEESSWVLPAVVPAEDGVLFGVHGRF